MQGSLAWDAANTQLPMPQGMPCPFGCPLSGACTCSLVVHCEGCGDLLSHEASRCNKLRQRSSSLRLALHPWPDLLNKPSEVLAFAFALSPAFRPIEAALRTILLCLC